MTKRRAHFTLCVGSILAFGLLSPTVAQAMPGEGAAQAGGADAEKFAEFHTLRAAELKGK